jgi:hypothetical protein
MIYTGGGKSSRETVVSCQFSAGAVAGSKREGRAAAGTSRQICLEVVFGASREEVLKP